MAFVQVIEFRMTHFDEMREVAEEWETATEASGRRAAAFCAAIATTPGVTSISCSSTHSKTRWRTPRCPRPMRFRRR